MSTVEFIEVAAEDVERAQAFYRALFGWEFKKMPGPMDYWIAETHKPDGQKGTAMGMMVRQAPEHGITIYVTVKNIDDAIAKLDEIGGTLIMPKQAVPQMGWFACCLDSENNPFAFWQEDPQAG